MTHNIHGTFISEKTNKIRWRPDPFNNLHFFITGSWDDRQNSIKLWDFKENEEDQDIYPYVINSYPVQGDVTEIKFVNSDLLVASTSLGSVHYLKLATELMGRTKIEEVLVWDKIHSFKNGSISSCTSLALYDTDIVTIGEDGRINLLTSQKEDVRTIEDADSCSLNCVTFLKFNEVLTGNSRGHMKIWDLRSNENRPSSSFMLSTDQIAPTCLAFHPTQRHMIVAGDEEGSLTVWDLRQNTFPVNLLSAHADSVSEIQFHLDHPDQLFSCSSAGELWHWSTNAPTQQGRLLNLEHDMETNPWFAGDNIKNKLEVFTLMPRLHKPLNSLDLSRDRVLCGCDNEAIYLISNVNIYK